MSTAFKSSEIDTLLRKAEECAGFDYVCDECGTFCGPHEVRADFLQWRENKLCLQCNDRKFREEQSELRALRSQGF